ncbi:carboxylesterase/lipase family protein [Allostreptomyces psammosilenae]|uniref:carboxylesterase/lipase family protein n=1 Tax=Allostreptomyces psammosilenae TaxID=1892865 RepID=UPI0015C97821|nr:carboxylesterase family protein [Allostreptomyces psammosilenae]
MFGTTGGRVRGRRLGPGVVAVLGIPYAAPPFGADRFQPPRPAAPWRGVRECVAFGPIPPQSARLPHAPSWSPGDHDVLSLNVWTPAPAPRPSDRPLPVLLWIHGGAYTFGSSAQPDHDGAELARAGLVVVTCNYRVGFEGFGHVPGRPDNRGLLDQVAALRWVRDNIAGFGGDPRNVTVAGQSAGAGSIACLLAMEEARGLFHRAIAHSVPDAYFPLDLATAITARIAAAAGVAPTAEGLASAPPEALVAATDQVAGAYRADPDSGPLHYDPVLYAPVLDGTLLPTDPLDALSAGAARDVDLLLCHTLEEHWLFHAVGSLAPISSWAELARFAREYDLPDRLVAGYRALLPRATPLEVHLALLGDGLFGEHTSRLAEEQARAGGRAHLARFARRRTTPHGPVRAWHAADVPFVFGHVDDPRAAFLIGGEPDDDDRALSRRMRRAWVDFATTGDPGWPPVTASTTPVRSWSVPADGLADDDTTGIRALWHGVRIGGLRA